MDLLQVKGNQIVDGSGKPVRLRGVCIGGWMNMENFINGYTGAEHGLRAVMAQALGDARAEFFFDRMLDHFFGEEDIVFIKKMGASVIRLPLNYRHFEDDARPFKYIEKGFQHLNQVLQWCEKYGLYAILDLHSVQGFQNSDWHSDNSNRQSYFWQHPHFQDRFVAIWEEFARRYKGNLTVAGYNVMNEPLCNQPDGRYSLAYTPNWQLFNQVYRRVVNAIRKIDSQHVIYLEGDYFSSRFDGLEAPFADNLVYSSHNYIEALQFTSEYPGMNAGEYWDHSRQEKAFLQTEGTQYAQKYQVPLWVGEFSPAYLGNKQDLSNRYRALDDQIDVIENFGGHWTTWTYKDIGVMSWVYLNPESEYMQAAKFFLKNKEELGTDFWFSSLPVTPAKQLIRDLASCVEETLVNAEINPKENQLFLQQAVSSIYIAQLMQPEYARVFKGMAESQLDHVLESFALKNCIQHKGVLDVVRNHAARPA
jgi:aryl-phospho-beta-D-glucosidase BglC (GH1 family)